MPFGNAKKRERKKPAQNLLFVRASKIVYSVIDDILLKCA